MHAAADAASSRPGLAEQWTGRGDQGKRAQQRMQAVTTPAVSLHVRPACALWQSQPVSPAQRAALRPWPGHPLRLHRCLGCMGHAQCALLTSLQASFDGAAPVLTRNLAWSLRSTLMASYRTDCFLRASCEVHGKASYVAKSQSVHIVTLLGSACSYSKRVGATHSQRRIVDAAASAGCPPAPAARCAQRPHPIPTQPHMFIPPDEGHSRAPSA